MINLNQEEYIMYNVVVYTFQCKYGFHLLGAEDPFLCTCISSSKHWFDNQMD